MKISLAMIVKNEARCLARCLRSARSVVNEIIVVDTGSTDDTVRIATELGARVFSFAWTGDFSAARNFALDQAAGDWILVLDADEIVTAELATEIKCFVHGQSKVGRLKIVSSFRRHGQTLHSQCFVSRLFPRGARFEGKIHEQIVSPLPRVNLHGELEHDGYLETQKSDRNVKLLLGELEREPDNAYFLHQLAIEYVSLDQSPKAFSCLQKAFVKLPPGAPYGPNVVVDLIYAAMAVKAFETGLNAIKQSEQSLADFPDFHLARGLFYMELVRSNSAKYIAELSKIEQSFQQCLALGESDKYKSVHGSGTFLAEYNLGVFYHVLGDDQAARRCFESAAARGHEPAATLLRKIAA